MSRRRIFACLIVTMALAGASSEARVFWQLGGSGSSSHGVLNAQEADWNRAYTAPLRINGGRAEISVWGTAQSVEAAVAVLRQRVADRGGKMYFAAGGELAWGVASVDGRVLRFLVSAGPGQSAQVFELVQDFDDYRASRTAPTVANLPDVPEMPESRISQVLANEATGLTLASSRSSASPMAARQQAHAALTGAGWQPLLSAGNQSGFYTRGRDLLVMSAVSAGRDGETVVTLAHKRKAAEGAP